MKQRPILFSAPMVRALLDGSKTQTRRVWKMPKGCSWYESGSMAGEMSGDFCDDNGKGWWSVDELACPYGKVGDQLWVRETFNRTNPHGKDGHYFYRADEAHEFPDAIWKPSIFMPRDASRITLEITGVRVERLQAISDSDCKAEGIQVETSYDFAFSHIDREHHHELLQGSYASLWESLNGAGSWDLNPWVWVIEFKKVKP